MSGTRDCATPFRTRAKAATYHSPSTTHSANTSSNSKNCAHQGNLLTSSFSRHANGEAARLLSFTCCGYNLYIRRTGTASSAATSRNNPPSLPVCSQRSSVTSPFGQAADAVSPHLPIKEHKRQESSATATAVTHSARHRNPTHSEARISVWHTSPRSVCGKPPPARNPRTLCSQSSVQSPADHTQ